MFRIKIVNLVFILNLVFFTSLNAEVLKFDDLDTPNYENGYESAIGPVPGNYKGFNWVSPTYYPGWLVTSNDYYKALYNNDFNFPSNPNAVLNGDYGRFGASPMIIYKSSPFNFQGAYFSTWTGDGKNYAGATQLTIEGKRNNEVIGTSTINLSPGNLSWNSINISNIDTLTFTAAPSATGQYWLMDNFTYTNPNPKAYGLFIGIKDGDTLRGDLDASNFYNALISNKIMDPHDAIVIQKDGNATTGKNAMNLNDIYSSIQTLNDKMKDGDRLLLYFSSHGDHWPDGTETTKNKGDEYIFFNENLAMDDRSLYHILKDNITKDVSKMFIMDVCQSGGFWGDFNPDNPDLEQLSNAALLAAAAEGKNCYADVGVLWSTGLGLFTNVLIDGINEGITDWDELAEYAKEHKPWKNPQVVYEKEKGDLVTFTPDMWDPVSFKTDDFTGDFAPVPLPNSIFLVSPVVLALLAYKQKIIFKKL